MRGMITWRFKIIMECLPFIMQVSLLFLGYALAQYMWSLSRTVSAVIATFTALGVLFYLFIVFAATVWKTCPFQTPVSVVLRHGISLAKKHQIGQLQKIQDRLFTIFRFRKQKQTYLTPGPIDEELIPLPQPPLTPSTTTKTVEVGDEESTHASDTNCISTMFRFAVTSDAVIALTRFIPEVNWTSNARRVPLLEVYDCLRRSFEFLKDGRVDVRPGMREQAYGSARALLHLHVQRLCAGATRTNDVRFIASGIGSFLRYPPGKDHELESTLHFLDVIFNGEKDIRWPEFVFSDAHYCWLSHVLRCRAWDTLRINDPLPKDVIGFVRHSLSKDPLPPSRVIADCLLIVHMMIGRLPQLDDRMLIKDKRSVFCYRLSNPTLTMV
jgi:hypothetical protein